MTTICVSDQNYDPFLAPILPDIVNATQFGGKDARSNLVLLCEHASNAIPPELQQLGLEDEALEQHIAYDLGAKQVTLDMAAMMGVPAVLANVSRLVIDCNRSPRQKDADYAGLIPEVSDGRIIPGNQNLSHADIKARVDAYFTPFHHAADTVINGAIKAGKPPMIVGIHSFTPATQSSGDRPWQIGLMWNKDAKLAQAMMGLIERETQLFLGANEPYSGMELFYTMNRHAGSRNLPHMVVEIRQDLLQTRSHQEEWAVLLANCLDECFDRNDLWEGM